MFLFDLTAHSETQFCAGSVPTTPLLHLAIKWPTSVSIDPKFMQAEILLM